MPVLRVEPTRLVVLVNLAAGDSLVGRVVEVGADGIVTCEIDTCTQTHPEPPPAVQSKIDTPAGDSVRWNVLKPSWRVKIQDGP